MPTIYSSLYQNFIRQGSTFAKSITTHGYAQSVVAATHANVLNSNNRPAFARRNTTHFNRLANLQLHNAFHTERNAAALGADHRFANGHAGLDAYFEALQKQQDAGEIDGEWTQFQYPKRIEWKPSTSTVLNAESTEQVVEDAALELEAAEKQSAISAEDQAVLAHIDAVLEREIELRSQHEAEQEAAARSLGVSPAISRSRTPASVARSATPPVDPQSQSYADHLFKLAEQGRYVEIPAVFEAMLATGVKPISSAYNALLMAAIHIPTKKIEIVSKALDVYADMMRRRISPDSETYDILVGLLASRSLEVAEMKSALEEKRDRFGGMEEPGKFMFVSHELEHAILCEDDRLDLAMKLFGSSVDALTASYSSETYHQLISACAEAGRVSDMLRLFEHMELAGTTPCAGTFPTMITAFASSGDLISAVEVYNEYRNLAIAADQGAPSLIGRSDSEVYASVINAYVISDKIEGAMKFFKRIVDEYGVRAVDIKDALVSAGFVKGFMTRGIFSEAYHWAESTEIESRAKALSQVAVTAADKGDAAAAIEAYASLAGTHADLTKPSMALLAMSIRNGDVASATKYWHILSAVDVQVDSSFIELTTMYAVALIGSGQVAEGLSQSEMMFERIRATQPQLQEQIEEGMDFVARYMQNRGLTDPRDMASQTSFSQSNMASSPFASTPTVSSFDESFDPHAHSTDFKGSSLIAEDLEGAVGRKGVRLGDALNRFRNIRRAGRHPRYITYAKLISAAAREQKMELCHEILAMARADIPVLAQYPVVRHGWYAILDAMVGACLTLGNRGMAEQYHQELLDMGSRPSANTYGLYITTLKGSTKTFDEASEAVRIYHRAKAEGVEPSSFLYNALIGKLGRARRIDDCLFYFAEMRAQGIKPTSVTYGTIVNALCRVSDESFAEELFDEMEEMPNYKARTAPYNSMMQFFLTTKRDKTKVLAYYERMLSKCIAPTAHTYKLLMDTHATLEPLNMAAAEQVLETMHAAGQRAEPQHYASLIRAHGCVKHDMEKARKVFDSAVEDTSVPINATLFQALCEAMVANHRVGETESVLAEMKRHRVELTAYVANILIHGWAAEKNIAKAEQIYQSVDPSMREPSTYEAMTRAYLATEERTQAQHVVREMLSRGYPTAVNNKVLELLGGGNAYEQVQQ